IVDRWTDLRASNSTLLPYTTLFRSRQLCASWGWGESQVTLLDSRPRWKLRQVEGELRLLVAALVRSYVSLKQFAEQRQVLSPLRDRKSTRLNSSHVKISYAVFCLKK